MGGEQTASVSGATEVLFWVVLRKKYEPMLKKKPALIINELSCHPVVFPLIQPESQFTE